MSKECIKLGEMKSDTKFLFASIILNLFLDAALGSANVPIFKDLKALDSKNLSNCFLVRQTFCYIFTIIMGYIFYLYEKKHLSIKKVEEEDTNKKNEDDTSNDLPLIHNEREEIKVSYSYIKVFFIIFLWVLEEQILSYFKDMIFLNIDFWMLELIIIHFLLILIFKIEVYKHQWLMIGFSIFPSILKSITIKLSFDDKNNEINDEISDEKYEYKYNENVDTTKLLYVAIDWLMGLALPAYIFLISCRSYVYTKIKWIMDKKYISSNIILVLYGIVGALFCIIINIIVTFIPCGEKKEKDVQYYRIEDYFFKVEYKNEIYLDNFLAYFEGLNKLDNEAILEIFAIIFGVISFFFYKYFSLKVIQKMTPVHLIFSYPIFYVFNKIYLLILNTIKNNSCILEIDNALIKLILDFSSDILSIIDYIIYLEIIELHFCGYDFNTRKNILARGNLEVVDLDSSIKSRTRSDYSMSSSEEHRSSNEKDISIES